MSKNYLLEIPATSANMGPGFDSFGIALQLYNTFAFRPLEKKNRLVFSANFLPKQNSKSNLIYQAYLHTLKAINYKSVPGIEIIASSEIPSARGLGSSATAIVAGVMAAGVLSDTNLKFSEVIELATEIEGHPDNIAPAVLGGMTISMEERNYVYTEKIHWPNELAIIVAIPNIKVHTNLSRKVIPKRVPLKDAVFNIRCASLLIASLYNKNWDSLEIALNDRLHQNQRASLIPGLNKVLNAAKDKGALGAVLSGSGPSILAIALNENKEVIENIKTTIKNTWKQFNIESRLKVLEVQKSSTKIKVISNENFEEIKLKTEIKYNSNL